MKPDSESAVVRWLVTAAFVGAIAAGAVIVGRSLEADPPEVYFRKRRSPEWKLPRFGDKSRYIYPIDYDEHEDEL